MDFIYIMISRVARPQFSPLLLLPATSNLILSRDLVGHLFRVSSFVFCASLSLFVLYWCPVPAVHSGVRKCLNSNVVGPIKFVVMASRILMVWVFEFNPCPAAPWFSDCQACFWLRYKVVVAVDPAEFTPFKVVDEEDVP